MNIKTYIFILFLAYQNISIAQEIQPFSGRVSLSLSASENIKGEIQSYISRELRSLGDITVTNLDPTWELSIVAIESYNKAGDNIGVVISVVILEPFDNSFVLSVVNEESKDWVNSYTTNLYTIGGHWVRMGGTDSLREICSSIVADFDSDFIQDRRELYQKVRDMQKQN